MASDKQRAMGDTVSSVFSMAPDAPEGDDGLIDLWEIKHGVTFSSAERARIKQAVGFLRDDEEAGNVQN